MLILYFIPIWLNVFALSLLSVFYLETWISSALKFKFKTIYICLVLNFIFLIIAIIIIIFISQKSNHSDVMVSIYEGYAAFLDISLSALLFGLGYNFYITSNKKKSTKLLPVKKLSTFHIINCLISTTYLIRGIFSLIIALQIQLPFNVSVDFSEYHDPTSSSVLFFFLLLEYFPVSLIVYLLWRRVYFQSNPNEAIEKLLAVDDENVFVAYNINEELSDAEAVNLAYENSYISSYNLIENDDNDVYDSVIYPNDSDNNILNLSPMSERSNQTNRTSFVGNTPPPKHFANLKPAALDFLFISSRTSPFAITNTISDRENSPSLQISPASTSSFTAYENVLSRYTPPILGSIPPSHLHGGVINDRDVNKLLNTTYTTRDSLNSDI